MRVIEHLLKTLRDSAIFNPEVQVSPRCVLWPDKDRQWEAVIPRLQSEMGELLVLGDYVPENRVGPAIWLRCVIAGQAADVTLPADRVPVFYLPGVSRQDLRAIEDCPDLLKPLAELQYRGVIWSQANAKDWKCFLLRSIGFQCRVNLPERFQRPQRQPDSLGLAQLRCARVDADDRPLRAFAEGADRGHVGAGGASVRKLVNVAAPACWAQELDVLRRT